MVIQKDAGFFGKEAVICRELRLMESLEGVQEDLLAQAREKLQEQREENIRLKTYVRDRGDVIRKITEQLQIQAEAHDARIQEVNSRLKLAENQRVKLLGHVQGLEEEKNKLVAELKELQARFEDNLGHRMEESRSVYEKSLAENRHVIESLRTEVASLKTSIAAAQDQIERIEADASESKALLHRERELVSRRDQELSDSRAMYTAVCEGAEAEKAAFEQACGQLKKSSEFLEKELSEVKAHVAELNRRDKVLRENLRSKDAQVLEGVRLFDKKEKDFLQIKNLLEEERNRISQLDEQLSLLKEENHGLEEEKENLSGVLVELQEALHAQQAKNLELNEELNADNLHQRIESVTAEKEAVVSALEELRRQLEVNKSVHEQEQEQKQARIDGLAGEVEILDRGLKEKSASLGRLWRLFQKERARFRCRKSELQQEVEKFTNAVRAGVVKETDLSERLVQAREAVAAAEDYARRTESEFGVSMEEIALARDLLAGELTEERRRLACQEVEYENRHKDDLRERDILQKKIREIEELHLEMSIEFASQAKQYGVDVHNLREKAGVLSGETDRLRGLYEDEVSKSGDFEKEVERLSRSNSFTKQGLIQAGHEMRELEDNFRVEKAKREESFVAAVSEHNAQNARLEKEIARLHGVEKEYENKVEQVCQLCESNKALHENLADLEQKFGKLYSECEWERAQRREKELELDKMVRVYRYLERSVEESDRAAGLAVKMHGEYIADARRREQELRAEIHRLSNIRAVE